MPLERSQTQTDALSDLERAIQFQDMDMVEHALAHAFDAGLHANMSSFLIMLADAHWHTRHEDVVLALQRLRSPEAVDALERVALTTYGYRDYDECDGLARKCTWALADIGTPAAYQALERLARAPNPIIVGYATKRIAHWHDERHRKLT